MYYRRYLEERLTGPVSRNKVRLLFGARQTGKTWLLRRLLAGEEGGKSTGTVPLRSCRPRSSLVGARGRGDERPKSPGGFRRRA